MTNMPVAPPSVELYFRSHLAFTIGRQLATQTMSVRQLSDATRIDEHRLNQILQGIGLLTVPEFVEIASHLECKPSELTQD